MQDTNQFPVLNFQDFIHEDGGKLTTDSRKVAAVFGKRHDHVLAAIRKRLKEAGPWGVPNFWETPYTDQQNGQTYTMFEMTKDGFVFLVQKFAGKKATQFQIAYIEAFNAMEQYIRVQHTGLTARYFEQLAEYKGKKEIAGIHGRGLRKWRGEKKPLEASIQAIEEKMNPELPLH